MARGLSGRLGQYLLVVLVAFSLNFLLPHLAPGDPVSYVYEGAGAELTEAQAEELRASYDLHAPLPVQYVDYWAGIMRGDLGVSVRRNRPVVEILANRVPWTLALVLPAAVLAATAGTLLGATAARRRGRGTDVALTSGTLLIDAMPGFWIGMVLIAVVSAELGWLPSFGAVPLTGDAWSLSWLGEVGKRLVLPTATITLATVGGTFLLARGAMLSALDEPYVLLAHANGAPPRRVVYRHALRNALLPVYTNLTLVLATMLSGAVVVETVFSYPGLGRLVYESTLARDYPLLRGAFLLLTLGVVLANLVADVTYPLLDPRVRRRGEQP